MTVKVRYCRPIQYTLNVWPVRQSAFFSLGPCVCVRISGLKGKKRCQWNLKKMSELDMLKSENSVRENDRFQKSLTTMLHFFTVWTDNTSPYTLRGRCKKREGEGRGRKARKGKGRGSPPSPLFFYLHSPPLPYRRLPRRKITIRYKTYLSQTFLSSPYWSVDDFEEKLSRARIEDKDGTVDWFRGQVTFERLKWKRRGKCSTMRVELKMSLMSTFTGWFKRHANYH